eukprot:112736_1
MLLFCIIVWIFGVSMSAVMPSFSWDTVPVFIHMCNASGSFSESALQHITKFPMVTVEKGQGINATMQPYANGYAEDKILEALRRVKEINSSITTIMYMNSILDWTFYRMHETFIEHPEWWLNDEHGNIVLISGDGSFPQPKQGMLVFDYQQQIVQRFFAQSCLNMTRNGYIDGCFADRPSESSFHGYNLTQDQTKAFSEGHTATLLSIQKGLNQTNKSILISNGYYTSGIVAVQLEGFAANEASIKLLQNYASLGVLVQAHAGYNPNGDDNHCQHITNSLAAFLIGAGKYSYYGCSRGWYIEPDWIIWHSEYDQPLGAPCGVAEKTGNIYTRRFTSGTKVIFNITNNVGTIDWSS